MEVVSESSLGDVKLKAPVDPLQQANDVDGLKVNGDVNGDDDMEVGEEDSPCNGDQAELSENGVNDEPMDESETPDLQESEQGQGSEQGSEPELDSEKEQEPDQEDDEEAIPIKEEIEEPMPEDMTKSNLPADDDELPDNDEEEEPKENDSKEEKPQVKEENVSEDKTEGDNGESTDSAPQESDSQKDVIDLVTPVKDPDSKEGDGESTPEKTPSKKKKVQPITNVTPRRSSRNLNKTKSYIDDAEIKSEEEEAVLPPVVETTKLPNINLPPSVTLAKKNTIVVSDTKRLAEIAAGSKAAAAKGGKKEPTLVIIDTNSLLANKSQHQVSLTPTMPSRVSVVPVAAQNLFQQKVKIPTVSSPVTITPPKPQVILPSLTDDMFVVEAPSFIVPYVYEKPPINALKEYLKDLEQRVKVEADEKRKKEDEEEKERQEEEKKRKELEEPEEEEKMDVDKPKDDEKKEDEKKEDEKKEESGEKEDEKMDIDKNKEEEAEDELKKEDKAKLEDSTEETKKEDSEKIDKDEEIKDKSEVKEMKENEPEEKKVIETDDKKPSETDEKKSSEKEENKATEKDEKKPADKEEKKPLNKEEKKSDVEEKKSDVEVLEDKTNKTKSDNYFENPLGKFFMQIGINLVQEHVQADLLKNQLRKKDKEGSKCSADVHMAISALTKTLEVSKENNKPFRYELKKCQLCNFKTESQLAMAHHLETPHMKNFVYRCNFCELEVRSPHDILFHMEAEHNVRGRLDRSPAFHQCPNCPFEDNQKGKLSRHLLSCAKKYKPERNQEPPLEWEPPAKIPRVRGARGLPLYPGGPAAAVAGSMSGGRVIPGVSTPLSRLAASQAALAAQRGRGRPPIYVQRYPPTSPSAQKLAAHIRQGGVVFRPSNQPPVLLPTTPYSLAPTLLQQAKGVSNGATAKLLQQPSISITPLPRGGSAPAAAAAAIATSTPKPGRPPTASATPPTKNSFVICEICDGYIKDLEQLRNHMQWIHKVKIHPKMIYNRPPLNCQKCQFRFFTDQGLERHLLGSHGLVTSSMQEAANKGKDGGRCPVCGRVYQWKLLNHVARDHSMSLKPAHLSYKCTVCTATFGMYKQFENHVYSAHSVVAKRVMDKTKPNPSSGSNSSGPPSSGQPSTSSSGDGMLKPLKINDEITIIPQPARAKTAAKPAPQATSAATVTKTPASNSTK